MGARNTASAAWAQIRSEQVVRSGDGEAGGTSRGTGTSRWSASTSVGGDCRTATLGPATGAADRCSTCGGAVGTATLSQHPAAPLTTPLTALAGLSFAQQHDTEIGR